MLDSAAMGFGVVVSMCVDLDLDKEVEVGCSLLARFVARLEDADGDCEFRSMREDVETRRSLLRRLWPWGSLGE